MLGNKQLTFSKKLLFLLLIVSALLFTLVITGWLAESWKKFLIGCFLLWFLLFLLKLIRLIIRVFWACWLLHRWEQNIFQYDHQSHIAWMWLNDLFHRELYRATHQFHYFSSFRSCTDSVKKHMGNVAPETTSMLCKNTNWNFAEGLHCWKYIPCIKLAHLKPTTTRIHCAALDHYTLLMMVGVLRAEQCLSFAHCPFLKQETISYYSLTLHKKMKCEIIVVISVW